MFFLVYIKFFSNMSVTLIHNIKHYSNFLKLSSDCFITYNIFNITCCIDMDSFSTTSKAAILVAIYRVLCLQNKIFVDRVQKHFQSSNCCSNSTTAVFLFHHLPNLFFRYNVTFYSIRKYQVYFITLFKCF